jgi:RNA polymerase sigma factor (sigma-70 family)
MVTPEFLLKLRDGDGAAFATLVQSHSNIVRAAAARHFGTAFDRDEAVQDIWVHVYRQRQHLDVNQADRFEGWLATVAARRCVDLLRARGVRLVEPGQHADAVLATATAPAPSQDALVAQAQLFDAVAAFKARLKPDWQQFFDLHFVQGLPYPEVGARLHISALRCRYMKKVLAARAQRNKALMDALGRAVSTHTG